MSNSRRPSSSDSSSQAVRNESSSLRPLAPKARPLAPRPPVSRSPASPTHITRRNAPSFCPVCFKGDCQLLTHKAFGASIVRQSSTGSDQSAGVSRPPDPGFAASYAFTLAQQYAGRDIAASSLDTYYKLPIKPELDTAEMHQLFHDFFTVESQFNFRIVRPPEMVGDPILSPFFVPAMHDSALCLSILATAAAIVPTRSAKPARNVVSLTLIGETMQEMRERIEADPHQISDVTIVAATFLWLVNAWLEDVDAMDSHATSVVTFVNTRGGLGELGMVGAVAQFILWTDVLNSLITDQACYFPDELISDSDGPMVAPRTGSLWDVPPTALVGSIHPSVALSCQETSKLLDTLQAASTEGMTARRYLYLVQRLCSLCKKDTYSHVKLRRTSTPDECILLAISLIRVKCFCANNYLRDVLTNRGVTALADAVQRTSIEPTFWQDDLDMLIWLLFALFLGDADFEGRAWGLALLCQAVTSKFGPPVQWLASWVDELNRILNGFAWSNIQLTKEFQRTCELIANAHGLEVLGSETEVMVTG